MSEMKVDALVSIYIQLRDRRATRKAAYEADDAKDKSYQEKIEAKLLAHFNATGTDKVGCEFGTAYTSTRTSAKVADWDQILGFIKMKALWNMLEHRVSKTAVEEYMQEHQELPPGVNISREIVVNVRRS